MATIEEAESHKYWQRCAEIARLVLCWWNIKSHPIPILLPSPDEEEISLPLRVPSGKTVIWRRFQLQRIFTSARVNKTQLSWKNLSSLRFLPTWLTCSFKFEKFKKNDGFVD
ncbi:uncharacterized protein LOC144314074 [Canis aureus]